MPFKEFELSFKEVTLGPFQIRALTKSSRCVHWVIIWDDQWERVLRNPGGLFVEDPKLKDKFLEEYVSWCHRWQRFHNFKCSFVFATGSHRDSERLVVFFKDQADLDLTWKEVQVARVMLS